MRKNFGSKPWTYPQPVFIIGTYDENGKADAMNAAWGGLSEEDEVCICLSPGHKTVANILATGCFTVSMATEDQVVACDYVGIDSGNDVPDKMEKAGFHTEKAENVNAPLIKELPMTLECTLLSWQEEICLMKGKIVNISADESVLTNGKIDPKKLRPIVFDPVNHAYYGLGEKAGDAFRDGLKLR